MKKWYPYLSICEDSTTSLLSDALKHHRVINIATRMMRAIPPTLLWLILSPRKMMPIRARTRRTRMHLERSHGGIIFGT